MLHFLFKGTGNSWLDLKIKRIYHVDEVRIGKIRGVNLLVWTDPWRGPDGRFIPRVFPILTSSTWLIIYLAYFLPKLHFYKMFVVLSSIWPIFRKGKAAWRHRVTSSLLVYVRIQERVRTTTGKIFYHCEVKRLSNLIRDIVFIDIADDGIKGKHLRWSHDRERQRHVIG